MRKEIMKISTEINEMSTKNKYEVNESKDWFFEKIQQTNP